MDKDFVTETENSKFVNQFRRVRTSGMTNKSILILILVVAFTLGYLYYSQSIQPTQLPISPPPLSVKNDLLMFQDLTIDLSVLDDSKFKSLRVFGESPVKPGVTGKRDLFAPF